MDLTFIRFDQARPIARNLSFESYLIWCDTKEFGVVLGWYNALNGWFYTVDNHPIRPGKLVGWSPIEPPNPHYLSDKIIQPLMQVLDQLEVSLSLPPLPFLSLVDST